MNPPTISPLNTGLLSSFIWYPEYDMGYYPVVDAPYDQDYWDKYVGYAESDRGKAITNARIEWVNKWTLGDVVDVGIGCGHFITERGKMLGSCKTFGYDINPVGLDWLVDQNLLMNPYDNRVDSVTLWDVIEHIHNPQSLLDQVDRYVFATIPIFYGPDQAMTSKHFRKDEHCWYWTVESFPKFMKWFGFDLIGTSSFEADLGREDVATFAFERR
jgi:ubiquinone/menaquinone biosynthesis C-methylase UbiE